MISILICEDNDFQRKNLETIIQRKIIIQNYDMKIRISTKNPDEIIEILNTENPIMSIYFLDINLNHKIDGLYLASKIRNKNLNAKIIFFSTYSELIHLTFEYNIEALDYILKDDPQKIVHKVTKCLEKSHDYFSKSELQKNNRITLNILNKTTFFYLKDILFFETSTSPHKIIMHLNNTYIEFYGVLSELEKRSDYFVRIHNSYLVNYDNITYIDRKNKEIWFSNGEKCDASFRGIKKLNIN